MADAFSIKFDASGLNAALDRLGDKARELARPAAQAGAQVLYEEVRLRAPVSAKGRKLKSGRVSVPGTLRNSIYQVYSKDHSNAQHATYHISWNARKAPHGHLVEYGTSRAAAHPFLRPAYAARKVEALQTAKTRFTQLMGEALGQLA